MYYRKLTKPTLTAVGVANQSIHLPFGCTNVMAEVIVGAGSGTTSVQFSGSNDNTNFTNIGSAITSTNRAVTLNADNQVFLYYRASTTIATNTKETTVNFYCN